MRAEKVNSQLKSKEAIDVLSMSYYDLPELSAQEKLKHEKFSLSLNNPDDQGLPDLKYKKKFSKMIDSLYMGKESLDNQMRGGDFLPIKSLSIIDNQISLTDIGSMESLDRKPEEGDPENITRSFYDSKDSNPGSDKEKTDLQQEKIKKKKDAFLAPHAFKFKKDSLASNEIDGIEGVAKRIYNRSRTFADMTAQEPSDMYIYLL